MQWHGLTYSSVPVGLGTKNNILHLCSNGTTYWPYLLFCRIPWNGKQDILIDRFDGRALLDFIRDPSSRHFRALEKSEEEEELEEFVNFERYRDLIKHRRRGCRYLFGFSILLLSYEFAAPLPFAYLWVHPDVLFSFIAVGFYFSVGVVFSPNV